MPKTKGTYSIRQMTVESGYSGRHIILLRKQGMSDAAIIQKGKAKQRSPLRLAANEAMSVRQRKVGVGPEPPVKPKYVSSRGVPLGSTSVIIPTPMKPRPQSQQIIPSGDDGDGDGDDDGDSDVDGVPSSAGDDYALYASARADNERAKANTNAIKVAVLAGSLLDKSEVEAFYEDMGVRTCSALRQMAAEMRDVLADISDPVKVEKMLLDAIEQRLGNIREFIEVKRSREEVA